jgi:hypothetical protein
MLKVEAYPRRPSQDIPNLSHGLWSLWEAMERFKVDTILDTFRVAGNWANQRQDDKTKVERDFAEKQSKALGRFLDRLRPIGLSASCATIGKLRDAFDDDDCTGAQIAKLAQELIGRLIDETEDKVFFSLFPKEIAFFNEPRRGWELAVQRFPKIVDDVEEASKCLALSRYPAAVFHSTQTVEWGLVELGIFLKVKDPHSGWTSVAGALKNVIDKKHKDRTRFEKQNFAFLEQMQGTVESLKNAWRNKISHAQGKLRVLSGEFNPDVAEEIFVASRAFMRRLAEGLPPAKPTSVVDPRTL